MTKTLRSFSRGSWRSSRALREEAARQSGLLDAMLRKVDGIERSQFN